MENGTEEQLINSLGIVLGWLDYKGSLTVWLGEPLLWNFSYILFISVLSDSLI